MAGFCSLSIFAFAYVVFFAGETELSFPATEKIRQRVELPEITLGMATSFDGVAVQQSYLQSPRERIFLERYPVAFEPIEGAVTPEEGEIAEPFFEPDSHWYQGFDNGLCQTSFNCGTFAVGDFLGLEPTHVLDGVYREGYGNPLQNILDEYFDKVIDVRLEENFDPKSFENRTDLQVNDVVCFLETRSPIPMFAHAGRVIKVDGSQQFLSKMGRRGPVMKTNLKTLLRIYDCNRIQVFRFRINDT